MSGLVNGAKKLLAIPAVFDLYQRLIGAPYCLDRFVADWIRARPGDRLLDIGCGTGAMAPHLPPQVTLVGVDISEVYIQSANARFGDRGRFLVADASDLTLNLGSDFDIVFASGVLHHIPDEAARRVLDGAMSRLRPGGRFVSIDPTLVADQSWISRAIVNGDRGQFVRSPEEMRILMAGYEPAIEISKDMLRIPFAQVLTTIIKR